MTRPNIIDLFERHIHKGDIDVREIIQDKTMLLDADDNYSKHQLDVILNSLDSLHPLCIKLNKELEFVYNNRSNRLRNIGLFDYETLHYTSVGINLNKEINYFSKFITENSCRLTSEKIETLDINPQNILNKIIVETNKIKNIFKKKKLNEFIEKTTNEQKLLFMEPRSFYFHLIDLIELGIE